MKPFIVNISSVYDFQACPLRWYFKWILNRVPLQSEQALNFGKMMHEAFEMHFQLGVPMADAIIGVKAAWEAARTVAVHTQHQAGIADIDGAFEELAKVEEAVVQWKDLYPIEQTLEVEEPFEYLHPDDPSLLIRGRPDRMVVAMGKIFHIQNRTLAAGKNFGTYLEVQRRNYHEHIYKWAMKQKYAHLGLEYGGTIFNLIRKLKYRGVPTKKDPEGKILHGLDEMMFQHPVSMTDDQTELAMRDILYDATQMRRVVREVQSGQWPSPNRKLDNGPFGNSIDPFFNVLMGKVALSDNNFFKDRDDMYAAPNQETN